MRRRRRARRPDVGRGRRRRGSVRARLRRLRGRVPVRLHVLPPSHAAPLDGGPARRAAEDVYIVYDPTCPAPGGDGDDATARSRPGQAASRAIYFVRLDGATGAVDRPEADRHPRRPATSCSPTSPSRAASLHALWWDTRNDPTATRARARSATAPTGDTVPSLDAYAATSTERRRDAGRGQCASAT